MEKIKLGSLCITNLDKTFDDFGIKTYVKKGTFVSVCDDDYIKDGYVTVEIEGYDTVFDFKLTELTLIKNYL